MTMSEVKTTKEIRIRVGLDEENVPIRIDWQAEDPNGDTLIFDLHYQPVESDVWLPLASDLTGASHAWDVRPVPDGFVTVRLTASDRRDNSPDQRRRTTRISDPVLIDRTPPRGELQAQVQADGSVRLSGRARDVLSTIAQPSNTTPPSSSTVTR